MRAWSPPLSPRVSNPPSILVAIRRHTARHVAESHPYAAHSAALAANGGSVPPFTPPVPTLVPIPVPTSPVPTVPASARVPAPPRHFLDDGGASRSAAAADGVRPAPSSRSGSDPKASNAPTASACPCLAATCAAVERVSPHVARTSARARAPPRVSPGSPSRAARCAASKPDDTGVEPARLFTRGDAPARSNARTTPGASARMATCRGVCPSASVASTSFAPTRARRHLEKFRGGGGGARAGGAMRGRESSRAARDVAAGAEVQERARTHAAPCVVGRSAARASGVSPFSPPSAGSSRGRRNVSSRNARADRVSRLVGIANADVIVANAARISSGWNAPSAAT